MWSVENFYWILFENLLKPVGLDCWYHLPFGTNHQLIFGEYKEWVTKDDNHVFFYFDQEPMASMSGFDRYDTNDRAWCYKLLRILANSEKSQIKKKVCQQRNMLDWYFFYHGFAALSWFRDAKYLSSHRFPLKTFCSFNHLCTHKRSYRMALMARLFDLGIADLGQISFHATAQGCQMALDDDLNVFSRRDRDLIQQHLAYNSRLPLLVDRHIIDGKASAHFGLHEYNLWQECLLHVVNESVFHDPIQHLTEKIFKPIVAMRPFVLVSAPGNLAYLRSYGFQTFAPWIDESYDLVEDSDQRLDQIAGIVEQFCRLSAADLQDLYQEMLPVLEHNKQHFFGDFRRIIVDELVENFDACIRIWNNGRVDGRQRPRCADLERVKQLLLR